MSLHRTTRIAALAATLAAVATPTAAHAVPHEGPPWTSSLAGTSSPVDLRSPDAVDAATPRGHAHADDGTDWDDVALVGGGGAAVVALVAAGGLVALRRDTARRAGAMTLSR